MIKNIYQHYSFSNPMQCAFLLFLVLIISNYLLLQYFVFEFKNIVLLCILFLINLMVIKFISKKVQVHFKRIIFNKININLNLHYRNVSFSQKNMIQELVNDKKIQEHTGLGFNFYITLVVENLMDESKVLQILNNKIESIFKNFLEDTDFDYIMAKEHWYKLAYAIFIYFILLILIIELVYIGKQIIMIQHSEIFIIFVLLTLLIDFFYSQIKKINYWYLLSLLSILSFFLFDIKIMFNETYSISLLLLSLFLLLYITGIIIETIKPTPKTINFKEDNLDKLFLIDIYFNKRFLSYKEKNNFSEKVSMKKEIFYILVGFLFSLSVPLIINEVKTPTIAIENTTGVSNESREH